MNGSILSCSSCECAAKHNLWINPEKNSCTKSLNNTQGAQSWNVNILLLNDEENLTLVFCFLLQFVQCVSWCVCDVCGVCVCAVNEQGWLDDEEFGRQRLAGINPMHIELLTVKICPVSFTLDRTVVLFGYSFLVQKIFGSCSMLLFSCKVESQFLETFCGLAMKFSPLTLKSLT